MTDPRPLSRLASEPLSGALKRTRLALVVLRCQSGDEQAFTELVQAYGPQTLRYLQALVGDDAEDVLQETWLAAFRGIRELHDPGAFHPWLLRTARHRALNWLRKHQRERELLVDSTQEPAVEEPAEPDFPPDLDFIDEARLNAAMREMPPPQREVLVLRYRDDLSYAQIAQLTAVPLGTVRTRLHHARKRLARLLNLGDSNDRKS